VIEDLFLESVALIRSLIRFFNLNFVFYFKIGEIESVQKSVLTDKKDVVSKNVKFKKVKMTFLNDSVFRAEVTKLFFHFINFIKRMFYVF
jgi:hypothetical protein